MKKLCIKIYKIFKFKKHTCWITWCYRKKFKFKNIFMSIKNK